VDGRDKPGHDDGKLIAADVRRKERTANACAILSLAERRNREMRVAVVKAAHDDEAGVWYVEHSDVDGLHVEGETFEAFRHDVAGAVGDLLEGESDEAHVEVIAHASMRARAVA
jgi:uncharacterized protein DUF1902